MTDVILRPARRDEARRIAEFYRISSDGVADYLWSEAKSPDESALDYGARRYAREGVEFSYENCTFAERARVVIAMAHAYVMGDQDEEFDVSTVDPVLRPYAELELPGSFYISGVAVESAERGGGVGTVLLRDAYARAHALGCPSVSLIVFEQNARALRLYAREGFAEIGRRAIVAHPLVHFDGDAILMRRGL